MLRSYLINHSFNWMKSIVIKTPIQSNYACIEREMLSLVFACTRFHQLVYHRKIIVHNDHRPIVSIMQKPPSACPPRLQRMGLLSKYDLVDAYSMYLDVVIQCPIANQLFDDIRNILPDLASRKFSILMEEHNIRPTLSNSLQKNGISRMSRAIHWDQIATV